MPAQSVSLPPQFLLSLTSWPSLFFSLLRHFLNPESYISIVSAYCFLSVHLSATLPPCCLQPFFECPIQTSQKRWKSDCICQSHPFYGNQLAKVLSPRQCTLCWPDSVWMPLCPAHTLELIVYGKTVDVTCIRTSLWECENLGMTKENHETGRWLRISPF